MVASLLLFVAILSWFSLLADPVLDVLYIYANGPLLIEEGEIWLFNAFLCTLTICFAIPLSEAIKSYKRSGKAGFWHFFKEYLRIMLRYEELILLRTIVHPLTKVACDEDYE